jgi:hypothetical protein
MTTTGVDPHHPSDAVCIRPISNGLYWQVEYRGKVVSAWQSEFSARDAAKAIAAEWGVPLAIDND